MLVTKVKTILCKLEQLRIFAYKGYFLDFVIEIGAIVNKTETEGYAAIYFSSVTSGRST